MENLNLVNLLKDCPKGTKLYSPIYGEVKLVNVLDDSDWYPISVKTLTNHGNTEIEGFTTDGKYWRDYGDGECLLWPSKDCRDWSQFVPPMPEPELKESEDENIKRCIGDVVRKYGMEFATGTITKEKMLAWLEKQGEQKPEPKPEPKPKHKFNPFDRVLVRDADDHKWRAALFDTYYDGEKYPYGTMIGYYKYCIPYEGNEHLKDTTDKY